MNKISGIGNFTSKTEKNDVSYIVNDKVFLIEHLSSNGEIKTIEIRTDNNLKNVLKERFESVMDSRYFGRGGIEIVMSGQLTSEDIDDLIRLSYNLTKQ
ncbi:MAG: hypothetical protein Q4E47_02850 [Candidatus Saccharibacteria bacterium]|nr:hypothetical protein [Candidatus Saccharibacteria bacterium]